MVQDRLGRLALCRKGSQDQKTPLLRTEDLWKNSVAITSTLWDRTASEDRL